MILRLWNLICRNLKENKMETPYFMVMAQISVLIGLTSMVVSIICISTLTFVPGAKLISRLAQILFGFVAMIGSFGISIICLLLHFGIQVPL